MQSPIAQQFRVGALAGTASVPNGLTPGDFDGDGALDLAITNEIVPVSGGFAMASRLANGTWGFRGAPGVGRVVSLALQLVGDPRPELLVSYSTFGAAGTNVRWPNNHPCENRSKSPSPSKSAATVTFGSGARNGSTG